MAKLLVTGGAGLIGSDNYGPYQFPEKVIPYFVALLMGRSPVKENSWKAV